MKVTIGRLLPLVIAGAFAVDVGARFLPLDALCFQAWECMTRYQEPGSIFQANRRFVSDRTHGNLSNMGNLPERREYRAQVFTTDTDGFRNAPVSEHVVPDGLVVGDSFVAGYGISDEETFPAQLSAATGRRFYNAGGPYAYLHTVRRLKARLGFARGPVIIGWTESEPVAQLTQAEALAGEGDARTRLMTSLVGPKAQWLRSRARGWWYTSPVKIVAEKAFLSLANDHLLPNVYRSRVVERRLHTGEPILFYPLDVEGFHAQRDTAEARTFLVELTSRVSLDGMTPIVLLAPSKYTVYYPLLEGSQPEPGDTLHPLAKLEQELRGLGIRALDLTARMQEQARHDLEQGSYLYWLDDTHWNGKGVAVAAELARQTWFAQGAETARAAHTRH